MSHLFSESGITIRSKLFHFIRLMVIFVYCFERGARGSVVSWGTMLHFFFSIYLIFPAALGPGVGSASNRNEYQESSWGVEGGRRVRLTALPPSVSRLSGENVGVSTSHNPMGLHGLLQGQLCFGYSVITWSIIENKYDAVCRNASSCKIQIQELKWRVWYDSISATSVRW
jgi:hypothetical protein